MNLSDHVEWIVERVAEARDGAAEASWKGAPAAVDGRSEAIVFIKPEVISAGGEALERFIGLVAEELGRWGVEVQDIGVLGWRYLADRNLMGSHYGVINRVSREGLGAIGEEAKANLDALGRAGERVLGGHQFLEAFPDFTPATLSVLWDNLNRSSERIAPGTYAIKVQVLSEYVWLLNGFHPYQLEHFHAPGKAIVVLPVKSETDWAELRGSLIGDTDPAKADPQSIRATLMRRAGEWGVPVVNKGLNGIHLSAGPLEGMVELVRFKALGEGEGEAYPGTNFGAQLEAEVGAGAAAHFAANPILAIDGSEISAFDATEGRNPADALAILRPAYG